MSATDPVSAHSKAEKTTVNATPEESVDNEAVVSSSTHDANKTTTTAELDEQNNVLLKALQAQLEYYFSPTNLNRDAFLRRVMSFNHQNAAPVGILGSFGNVNQILILHNIHNNGHDDKLAIYELLLEAAKMSDVLVVVEMDWESIDAEEDDGKDWERQRKRQHGAGGEFGIGPKEVPEITATNLEGQDVGLVDPSRNSLEEGTSPLPSAQAQQTLTRGTSDSSVQNNTSTIILRDMPDDTNEDEVRHFFESISSIDEELTDDTKPNTKFEVSSIRPDVGNNWFITLDTASNDVIVETMLSLRKMTDKKGDYIKARRKSDTISTGDSAMYQSSRDNSYYKPGTNYPGGGRYYNNDPADSNSSYQQQGDGSGYYQNNYRPRYPNSHTNNSNRGAYSRRSGAPHSTGHSRRSYYDQTDSRSADDKFTKKRVKEQLPPPPLLDSHFPALGEEKKPAVDQNEINDTNNDDDITVKSKTIEGGSAEHGSTAKVINPEVASTKSFNDVAKKAVNEWPRKMRDIPAPSTPSKPKPNSGIAVVPQPTTPSRSAPAAATPSKNSSALAASPVPVGGYAAALMKKGSISTPVRKKSASSSTPKSAAKSSSRSTLGTSSSHSYSRSSTDKIRGGKYRHSTNATPSNERDATSRGAADEASLKTDSTTDETSSKTDSEKSASMAGGLSTSPPTSIVSKGSSVPPSWGSKKSFIDILKKKTESGGVTTAK